MKALVYQLSVNAQMQLAILAEILKQHISTPHHIQTQFHRIRKEETNLVDDDALFVVFKEYRPEEAAVFAEIRSGNLVAWSSAP